MVYWLQTIHLPTACTHDPTVEKERPTCALCGGAPSQRMQIEYGYMLTAEREYPLDLCVGPKRTWVALSRATIGTLSFWEKDMAKGYR